MGMCLLCLGEKLAMGDEGISHWKACLVSREKEEELVVAF